MYEKVSPRHIDKIADTISGALTDLAYSKDENVKLAGEIIIGHDKCTIITESNITFDYDEVQDIVRRISRVNSYILDLKQVPQDASLASNQRKEIRSGDNGIFLGRPMSKEEKQLVKIARDIYNRWSSDGKYILCDDNLIICQSNAETEDIKKVYPDAIINPLGEWNDGTSDTGACLAFDTLINTKRGLIKIQDLKIGDYIYTSSNTISEITNVINRGFKNTKIIEDEYGGQIEATPDYKFKILCGNKIIWRDVSELKAGDILLIQKQNGLIHSDAHINTFKFDSFSSFGTHDKVSENIVKINSDFGYIMGWLVGDGNYTTDNRITFYYGCEEDKIHIYKQLCKVFNENSIRYYDCQPDRFCILSKGLVDKLKEIGLQSATSGFKEVPDFILKSTDSVRGAFLRGLFDTDDCFRSYISTGRKETSYSLSYSSASEKLINQIRCLLLNFGIRSTKSKRKSIGTNKIHSNYEYQYILRIRGRKSLLNFSRLRGKGLARKTGALNDITFRRFEYNSDSIYVYDLVKSLLNLNTLKKNKYFSKHLDTTSRDGYKEETIDYILDMYAEFSNTDCYKLLKFIYENYHTVKIKSLSDSKSNVYDISIDDIEHTFIANGYLTHNCNRKLGSDMGSSITGGGLWFKDLSKADVSCNIYCFLRAQEENKEVKAYCAIGDTEIKVFIDGRKELVPYIEIVNKAKEYIKSLGGFEEFAKWGLVR